MTNTQHFKCSLCYGHGMVSRTNGLRIKCPACFVILNEIPEEAKQHVEMSQLEETSQHKEEIVQIEETSPRKNKNGNKKRRK
jgi:proteasome assembly chaperone (PAC2) family protein